MPAKNLFGFFIAYGLSVFAAAIAASLFYFYVDHIIGGMQQIFLFLALYMGAGLICIPLWNGLSSHSGVMKMYIAALVYTATVFIGVCFLKRGDILPYAIICFASGLAFGADYLLPLKIIKQLSAPEDRKSHMKNLALFGMATKCATLLGILPALPFMGLIAIPPEYKDTVLRLSYGFVPCAVKIGAALLLAFWLKQEKEKNETPTSRGDAHAA